MLKQIKIKVNLLLYSLYYAKACNDFTGLISASLRPGNTDPFGGMSTQRWQAGGNAVFNLTSPRFEPQISRSRDERVTARPNELQITSSGTADGVASNTSVSHNTG